MSAVRNIVEASTERMHTWTRAAFFAGVVLLIVGTHGQAVNAAAPPLCPQFSPPAGDCPEDSVIHQCDPSQCKAQRGTCCPMPCQGVVCLETFTPPGLSKAHKTC
ncbi:uncharacterized protein LOC135373732 isoform X1 [Ornithodoros turicata]|uniref:uncharacterized protein LOC135373732 isoform X1 n=1 Tax=Ornithodoros turicata TaxID=34597 RepID=UPI003139D41B